LNPYRGCSHGCHYCYARATHAYLGLNVGEGFTGVLLVKTNFATVLRHELSARGWKRELVSLGTATDPYQPVEGKYRLARAALAALCDFRTPTSIVTKSTLVWRDLDVLQQMTASAGVTVCMSIPIIDRAAWRLVEPGTPPPNQRLRVLGRLVAAGINAGVLMAPILPGINSGEAQIEATVRAAAEHGARFLWSGLLHLDRDVRDHYLGFVKKNYPELLDGYERLYPGKYALPAYTRRIDQRAERLKDAWNLGHRYVEREPEEQQLMLL
jgi:DNA repair photolyase